MNYLIKSLALIGALTVLICTATFLWPLVHTTGTIDKGNYHGLAIGVGKRGILAELGSHGSDAKINAFENSEGKFEFIHWGECGEILFESDTWYVALPGIHRENAILTFAQDGTLQQIRYQRNTFDP